MGNVEKIKSPKNTVDFNKPVMGYDGTPDPESNLGKVVAPIIGSNTIFAVGILRVIFSVYNSYKKLQEDLEIK